MYSVEDYTGSGGQVDVQHTYSKSFLGRIIKSPGILGVKWLYNLFTIIGSEVTVGVRQNSAQCGPVHKLLRQGFTTSFMGKSGSHKIALYNQQWTWLPNDL